MVVGVSTANGPNLIYLFLLWIWWIGWMRTTSLQVIQANKWSKCPTLVQKWMSTCKHFNTVFLVASGPRSSTGCLIDLGLMVHFSFSLVRFLIDRVFVWCNPSPWCQFDLINHRLANAIAITAAADAHSLADRSPMANWPVADFTGNYSALTLFLNHRTGNTLFDTVFLMICLGTTSSVKIGTS